MANPQRFTIFFISNQHPMGAKISQQLKCYDTFCLRAFLTLAYSEFYFLAFS
jgi:hypothetical protein